MKKTPFPWYDSLIEHPLGLPQLPRRKNQIAEVRLPFFPEYADIRPGGYTFWQSHYLEGREPTPDTDGIWSLTQQRSRRHDGTLFEYHDPDGLSCPRSYTKEQGKIAMLFRSHHYYMLTGAIDIADSLNAHEEVSIAIEVTKEWYDPPGGVILPAPESPITGSHAVLITSFDRDRNLFKFKNSWGHEWGDNGRGYISPETINTYLIDSWVTAGVGVFPVLQTKKGIGTLLWSCSRGHCIGISLPDHTIYGCEVVDFESGERVAWTFAKKRGGFLDVEEFFVWPSHRGQGYARVLSTMLLELSSRTRHPLRAWINHVDTGVDNRDNLDALMRLLGLRLRPSGVRWAGLVADATTQRYDSAVFWRPAIPAVTRDNANGASPADSESAASEEVLYQIAFGTNRKPDGKGGFTSVRDSELHVGFCEVAVPEWHRFGEIKSNWWKRLTGYKDGTLRLQNTERHDEESFWKLIRDKVGQLPLTDCDTLLFIHGYNVDFKEAACRAAQIGFDLAVPGVMAFFSWPSIGNVFSYARDEATIEASEEHLRSFLLRLTESCPNGRVHIIAHSMGNRALLRVVQSLANNSSRTSRAICGEIILAAPDVDAAHFKNVAKCYASIADRTTLYASPRDRALQVSNWLHGYDRAGLTPPVMTVSGIDTVVVPGFNLIEMGHGYFADAAAVLYDMRDVLWNRMTPDRRTRLVQREVSEDLRYWEVRL